MHPSEGISTFVLECVVVLTCVQEVFTEHCKGAESQGAESCLLSRPPALSMV